MFPDYVSLDMLGMSLWKEGTSPLDRDVLPSIVLGNCLEKGIGEGSIFSRRCIKIGNPLLAFAASRHKNALFRYIVKNIICENNIVRDMSVGMRLKYVGTHIANYSL